MRMRCVLFSFMLDLGLFKKYGSGIKESIKPILLRGRKQVILGRVGGVKL